LNTIHLEEKEKKEKEMRNQIITEAEDFKKAFYEKRDKTIETNKTDNREKEKVSSDRIPIHSHLGFFGCIGNLCEFCLSCSYTGLTKRSSTKKLTSITGKQLQS